MLPIHKGANINYVSKGGGLAKCLCYYISLCSKLAYGGGIKNWQNLAYVVYGCPRRTGLKKGEFSGFS